MHMPNADMYIYSYTHVWNMMSKCVYTYAKRVYVWQFPLKMLNIRNPQNRETQISWYLAVQIQSEILD